MREWIDEVKVVYEVGALCAQISAINRPFIRGRTARHRLMPIKTKSVVFAQSGKSVRKVMI